MLRQSGTLASRPSADKMNGARYYATDTQIVYYSLGGTWLPNWPVEEEDLAGAKSGILAARPNPGSCIGWLYIDTDTQGTYEAFPTGWAAVAVGSAGTGAPGPTGPAGVQGPVGPAGIQGPAGPQGSPGAGSIPNTVIVSPGTGTIKAAADVAAAGTVLQLAPGEFIENIPGVDYRITSI